MARRRGWKRGDWLVLDEESGYTEYGTEVAYDYWGVLKRKDDLDPAHPQLFVRAKDDPHVVFPQHPPVRTYNTSAYDLGEFVGDTLVSSPDGPATHLYPKKKRGIGEMIIGSTFIVR